MPRRTLKERKEELVSDIKDLILTLHEHGVGIEYLHTDIDTLARQIADDHIVRRP